MFSRKEGIDVVVDNPPSYKVNVNESLLTTSLTTLIKASIILAESGSIVNVTFLPVRESFLTIRITSHGDNLSDSALETFWEPFSYHRSCSSVQQLGFGIPLAAKMIRAMSGSTSIENSDNHIVSIDIKLSCSESLEEKDL